MPWADGDHAGFSDVKPWLPVKGSHQKRNVAALEADPDSLLNRAELARTLARRLRDRQSEPRTLLDVVDVAPSDSLRTVLADTSIAATDRLALGLAGPAFQWR